MSNLPRLTYNGINVDFDRALNGWSITREQSRIVSEALSGIQETLNFFTRNKIVISKQRLNRTIQIQLERFWEYAKTGQSFSFRFDRDLMAYLAFESTTQDFNEISATFTRTGSANYVHPGTGLITSAAANTARFQSGKFGHGILIEDAMSQICLRSEKHDNAAWTATGITVTADTTEVLAPDGNATAEKLVLSAATGTLVQALSGAADIGTSDGVLSTHVYWSTGSAAPGGVKLRIKRDDTGVVLSEDSSYQNIEPNAWTRVQIGYNNGGAIAAKWRVEFEFSTNAAVYYIWGSNFEAGRRYATSYLAADATATTRNTEALSYTASNFFDDEPVQGSISFWWKPMTAVVNTEYTTQFFNLERIGTTNPLMQCWFLAPNVFFEIYNKAGSSVVSLSNSVTIVADSEGWVYIVVTWDNTVNNGAVLYINGSSIYTSTHTRFSIPRRGTNFYIGSSGASALRANAVLDDFEVRRDVLTAQEVLDRYNMAKALGWTKNYFSSLVLDADEYDPRLLVGSWRHDIALNFVEQIT